MNDGYQNDNYVPSYMNQTGVETNTGFSNNMNGEMNAQTSPIIMNNNTKIGGVLGSFNAPSNSFDSRMIASDIGLNFLNSEDLKPVEPEEKEELPDRLEIDDNKEEVLEKSVESKDKTSKRVISILFVIIGIMFVIIVLLALKLFSSKGITVESAFNERINLNTVATSFFIKDENDDYALFDIEGNRLSDFIYSKVGSFFNNRSIVSSNGNVGVIDGHNNKVIDFGSFIDIQNLSGIFKVTNNNHLEYLTDSEGNVIYDLKDKKVIDNDDNYLLIEDVLNNKYILLGSNGSELLSLSIVKNNKLPIIESFKKTLSFYYNNIIYIFNTDTLSKITSFTSDKNYNIIDSNDRIVLLSTKINNGKYYYKFIVDNNVYDLSSVCDEINISNGLVCIKDDKSFLLNNNFEKSLLIDERVSYVDSDNYVADDGESVYFYKNGELQNEVVCGNLINSGYSNNLYVLSGKKECGLKEEEYMLYDENGNYLTDEVYSFISSVDENGLYIVKSNDKEYIINNKGKRLSEKYDSIEYSLGFYIVYNGKYGLIDKTGKTILDLNYNNIVISNIRDGFYALIDDDLQYLLYNLNDEEVIYSGNTKPLLNNNYILIIEDGKNKFYSYINGKEFFEF